MSVEQADISPEAAAIPVADIATVLDALADPVRLAMVCQLDGQAELACGQFDVNVSKSTCTHHLKTLTSAGVLAERGEGVRKYMSLRRDELQKAYPGLLDTVLAGAKR